MSKREILGTMPCPECGASGAEIKLQKGGALLYRWCAGGCNAQFFARNSGQEKAMRAAVGAVLAPVTVKEPEREPEKAPELPKKKGTGNALLDLVQGVMT